MFYGDATDGSQQPGVIESQTNVRSSNPFSNQPLNTVPTTRASRRVGTRIRPYPVRYHHTQMQSMPYQPESFTNNQSYYANVPHQQQPGFTEDISRSAERLQTQTFQGNMQPENIAVPHQLYQNHPHQNHRFVQMPVNQEFCSNGQSILEAQMYEQPVTHTQAQQGTGHGSINYLQPVQPTYFTSEQSEQAKFYGPNFSQTSQETYPRNHPVPGLQFNPTYQYHQPNAPRSYQESCYQQSYDNHHQNHPCFYKNESTNSQQQQSAAHSSTYPATIPTNNQMLPTQQDLARYNRNEEPNSQDQGNNTAEKTPLNHQQVKDRLKEFVLGRMRKKKEKTAQEARNQSTSGLSTPHTNSANQVLYNFK